MVKFYGPKRRRRFDEEADWLPSKNRAFVMKQSLPEGGQTKGPKSEYVPPLVPKATKKTTDSEGLRRAYKADTGFYLDPAGTLHAAGTRGSFLGADWMENYKTYGPGLINKLGDMFGKLESGHMAVGFE